MAARKKPRQRISYVLPLANSSGGHRLGVNSLALDHDNGILYSGGRDGLLCAWEVDNSSNDKPRTRLKRQLHAHSHWVNDILLVDNNRALVSASSDITVKAWRPFSEDGNSVKDIGKHNDYVKVLASPGESSDWVVSAGLDHTVKIWDLNGAGEKLTIDNAGEEMPDKGSVYSLSARTSIIASGGPDRIVKLWDPRTGKRITKFVGHTDNIRSLLISEYGDLVMSGCSDQTIKVWSVTAGRCISTLNMHNESVWSLWSDHPQLSVFYSADRSGTIAKTDVRGSENLEEGLSVAVAHEHGGVWKLAVGGGSIWSATSSSSINRWKDIDMDLPLESPETPAQSRISNLVSRMRISKLEAGETGPKIPLSSVLSISNVQPPSFRDYEEAMGVNGIRRMSEAPPPPEEEEEVVPIRNLPIETIEGQNGLIKHEFLNDRKRVITLDTAGEVVLWDLIRCKPIQSFGKRHLEDVRREVDTAESIANWCTVATKAGSLTVGLEENYCFDGEVYADEANIEAIKDFKEDGRINIGKWVLRYLFSGLIDAEIKLDAEYRRQLELAQPTRAIQQTGLHLGQLPPRKLDPFNDNPEDTESITTPKATANGLPAVTPGLAIGVASPGLTQVMSNTTANTAKTPAAEDKSSQTADYFSSKSATSTPNAKAPDTTSDASATEANKSATEPDEKTKSPGLFGKKFRLPLKKLGRTSVEAPKSQTVEEKVEETDKVSEKEETVIEDNMFGVIQKIRLEYDQHLQHYPDSALLSAMTPSLPNETPVIKPPSLTSILIQEETPESGGLADLYRGTVGSVGRDVLQIEKVAPMWLGDLLLRNQIPLKEIVKVSFLLHPYEDLLPPIATEGNARLNANRMLRAKKIISYVTERIDPDGPNEENALKPEQYIDLYCNDQLVPHDTTLATLRAHIWRTGGDVVLYYKGNGKKPHLEEKWVREKVRLAEEAEKAAAATAEANQSEADKGSSQND